MVAAGPDPKILLALLLVEEAGMAALAVANIELGEDRIFLAYFIYDSNKGVQSQSALSLDREVISLKVAAFNLRNSAFLLTPPPPPALGPFTENEDANTAGATPAVGFESLNSSAALPGAPNTTLPIRTGGGEVVGGNCSDDEPSSLPFPPSILEGPAGKREDDDNVAAVAPPDKKDGPVVPMEDAAGAPKSNAAFPSDLARGAPKENTGALAPGAPPVKPVKFANGLDAATPPP